MSITFCFPGDATRLVTYSCAYCGGEDSLRPTPDCFECKGTGLVSFTYDLHEVQMANSNAFEIARALGWKDFNYAGELNAFDFLEIVNQTTIEPDCYFLERQHQLIKLGIAAARANKTVIWG